MPVNPTILRRRLGTELRELRARTGMSLEGASEALEANDHDISPSKLSRLENGLGAIKITDIRALVKIYEVERQQEDLLLQMAREARAAGPSAWWTDYESVLPSGLSTYVGLEAGASALFAFTGPLIEGLLQTEDYARSTIRSTRPTDPVETIDRLVELRMERQKVLRGTPRLDLVTIMDEAALLRPVGGRDVMRRQLERVVEICEELPNVTVQVIPLSKGAYAVQHGIFTLIEPQDLAFEPVAYVDSLGGNLYLQRPEQIQKFRKTFGGLQAIALDPDESLQVVRTAAEEMTHE